MRIYAKLECFIANTTIQFVLTLSICGKVIAKKQRGRDLMEHGAAAASAAAAFRR